MFNIMKNKSKRTQTVATRVVKTSRWIHRNELKVGMYVRELDGPWENTNFMFQGFIVDSLNLLRDVQNVSEHICIETEKLVQIPADSANRMCAAAK